MPTIRFVKSRAPIDVAEGTNLMQALLDAEIPVASSCHGDGVCAKCRLKVAAGNENLSPENDTEEFLREKHQIPSTERISCQVEVHGDVTIDASYW